MKKTPFLIIVIAFVFLGCNNKPKVIKPSTPNNTKVNPSGIFDESSSSNSKESIDFDITSSSEFHTVVANEILPTSKYVYINVTEGDETFWIATRSMDVRVGETYYYKGGLLKTNFESKEYNRVFDKVYLISNLISAANHGVNNESKDITTSSVKPLNTTKQDIEMHTQKIVRHEGSIKISDLVSNPKKYEGKTVQLDGVCTKINPGIMNRNWIHIKDGSKDDFDLVITSDAYVPEGSIFSIKALVVLNKDFGAGYKYDLILEKGILIK